jgi:hypothetical protein
MSEPKPTTIAKSCAALLAIAAWGCEPFGVSLGTQELCIADPRLADPALRRAGEAASNCAVIGDSVLVNAGFEAPVVGACEEGFFCQFAAADVPAWQTNSGAQLIEIWNDGHRDVPAPEGAQFVELDAMSMDTLWQDVQVEPGSLMYWSLLHRGRNGAENFELLIGPPDAPHLQLEIVSPNDDWYLYSGLYRVGPREPPTRLALASRFGTKEGNLLDAIYFAQVVEP